MCSILIFRSVNKKLLPRIFILFSLTSQIKGGKIKMFLDSHRSYIIINNTNKRIYKIDLYTI